MRFEITGPITPYTRMTQRGKWTPRAQKYLASQKAIRLELAAQMAVNGWARIPAGQPLVLRLTFSAATHRNDLSNLTKAIEDAANGVVWDDDRWIDRIEAARTTGGDGIIVVEVD